MTSFEGIQVKITPRERIFQQKQTSLKNTDKLINSPRCFYHPDDEITFFCKNPSCTLPLCEKCLNIHREEHLNKKEIPMQNVITFKECKQFVLTQLKQSQSKVKSVSFCLKKKHQEFQAKLMKYKESLFESIESLLTKLKNELYAIDRENSLLSMKQISQAFERVSQQSSLTDIIRCYEHYYEKSGQKPLGSNANKDYQGSIIDKIKFVLDQKQLIKVVEKGFLNCQFVRQKEKISTQRAKINCQEYLKQQRDSPQNVNIMKSPINQLNQLHDISMQDFRNIQQHVTWQQNVPINEFPISQTQTVIELKRQERRSIFKQKEQKEKQNRPFVSKTIFFNEFPSKDIKKQLKKQPLFSAVKQYKIDNESEDLELRKKDNLGTKNLKFEKQTIPVYTPHTSRVHSSSSMKSRGKGISLVKAHPLQEIDQIRQIQKQTTNNTKIRLKSQTNLRDQKQVSFSRQSLGDWKRVVNLTDSNASSSRQSKLFNQRQNYHAKKNEGNFMKTDLQGFQQFKGIDEADVLNPMEMRQLIMRKRNINPKAVENTNYLM